MQVNAISFGNRSVKKLPFNHEELEQNALLELYKNYQRTGKTSPARIDYYPNGTYKINYTKSKTNIFQIIKRLLKK